MKQIFIYQIGDTVVHWCSQNWSSYNVEPDVDETKFLHSWRQARPDGRGIYDEREIEISGVLRPYQLKRPHQQIGEIHSYVGHAVPVIGYILTDHALSASQCKCACADCGYGSEIEWFVTTAWVKQVETDDVQDSSMATELTIEFEMLSNWGALNPYFWHWKQDYNHNPLKFLDCALTPYNQHAVCPPSLDQLPHIWGGDICFDERFIYQNFTDDIVCDLLFNFGFWDSVRTGCFCKGVRNDHYETCLYKTMTQLYLKSDKGTYSAPPKPVFGVKGIVVGTDVTVKVVTEGQPRTETYESVLDVADLNQQLSDGGFTGLTANDEVLFGDVDLWENDVHYRPSLVKRDGATLAGIFPRWTYTRQFPAMLNAGDSQVWFLQDDNQSLKAAYLVQWQRA